MTTSPPIRVETSITIDLTDFETGHQTHGINLETGHDGFALDADQAEGLARTISDAAALLRSREPSA